jgi:hypothetical protein
MPIVEVTVDCAIDTTSFRIQQLAGLFDLPLVSRGAESFRAEIPPLDEPWQIGAIVGPSGSGKSTLARRAFPEHLDGGADWPARRAVIDCFPPHLSVRQVTCARRCGG